MMNNSPRPYKYRYRPYNYNENQSRELSRTRQNRRQLKFSPKEYTLIEQKIIEYGIDSFSEYVRGCIYDKEINEENLKQYLTKDYLKEKKTKRKQICFSDEEIELIDSKMKEINCNNFNQFIAVISLL